jgi:hypothetical protein
MVIKKEVKKEMWKSKKFYIPVIITAIIAGSLGGAVLADEEDESGNIREAMLDRICEIYEDNTGNSIDAEALQDAIEQARGERQAEALQNRLDILVEEGKITEEEADEIQDWYDSKPDVLPGMGCFGRGGSRGMGGTHGFGESVVPDVTVTQQA